MLTGLVNIYSSSRSGSSTMDGVRTSFGTQSMDRLPTFVFAEVGSSSVHSWKKMFTPPIGLTREKALTAREFMIEEETPHDNNQQIVQSRLVLHAILLRIWVELRTRAGTDTGCTTKMNMMEVSETDNGRAHMDVMEISENDKEGNAYDNP